MAGSTGPFLLWAQDVATLLILRVRRTVLQTAILLCVLLLLLWVSIFLYGSFYYSYMPTVSYVSPVHYQFRTDCNSPGPELCSFPVANVSFLKSNRDRVLMYGQPYRISVELELPESPVNQNLGMFMVVISCYTKGGRIISSSARSSTGYSPKVAGRNAMLHYRSSLLQMLDTVAFAGLFLSGFSEQKQSVEVELFADYKEDAYSPTIGAVIEIQTKRIHIYGSQLRIHAHFTGLRYLLYNFPVTSAILGVTSNFVFLSVLVLFSYLQWMWGSMWPRDSLSVQISGQETSGPQLQDVRRRVVIPKAGLEEVEEVPLAQPEDIGASEGKEQSEAAAESPSAAFSVSVAVMQDKKNKLGETDSGSEASLETEFESVENSSLLTEANFPSSSQEGALSNLLPPEGRVPSPGTELHHRSVCSSS